MDVIASPFEISELLGVDEQTVRAMCRDGRIRHAEKFGVRWVINATREWPGLFNEKEEDDGKDE